MADLLANVLFLPTFVMLGTNANFKSVKKAASNGFINFYY